MEAIRAAGVADVFKLPTQERCEAGVRHDDTRIRLKIFYPQTLE